MENLEIVNTFKIELKDIEISVRSKRVLKKLNIKTIGELSKLNVDDLLKHKNFGANSIHELERILRPYGLSLN